MKIGSFVSLIPTLLLPCLSGFTVYAIMDMFNVPKPVFFLGGVSLGFALSYLFEKALDDV